MIKTFRGLIADDTIDTIALHTSDGSTGYRIVKLEAIGEAPGVTAGGEHVIQIFTTPPTDANGEINFSNQDLLGCVYVADDTSGVGRVGKIIIFDKMIFNQDIYVTHEDVGSGSKNCNYYIELEQVKLDIGENTVATLKDIRNTKASPV